MKVLVLGGTGVTGKLVRKYLETTGWEIDCASRHSSEGSHSIILNLSARRGKIIPVLRKYDWVVACIGPFERWLDRVASLAIEAGVNYLDVNDSIDAREAILKLSAEKAGVTLMTGAGLCPGLSTALLMGEAGEPVKRVCARLNIGGGQPAGTASVLSMMSTMYGGYRILRDGKVEYSPHLKEKCEYVGYECPDLGSVESLFPGVQDYSYHVAFGALSFEAVQALQKKKLLSLPIVSDILAKKAATGVTRKAIENNSPKPTFLEIVMETEKRRTIARLGGMTSYQFTALSAVTCLCFLASHPQAAGVYEVARIPELREPLIEACRAARADYSVLHEPTGQLSACQVVGRSVQ